MEIVIAFIKKPFVRRIIILIIIGLLLYLVKSQITLLLLTYIMIFIVDSAQRNIYSLISKFIRINRKAIILSLYILVLGFLFLVFYMYVPKLIQQMIDIIQSITYFVSNYKSVINPDSVLENYIYSFFVNLNIQDYVKSNGAVIINVISNVGGLGLKIIMAVFLSLFYLMEKEKIQVFFNGFEKSKIFWIYDELKYFGAKFSNSFGKVMQTQLLISLINAVISTVMLSILGFPDIVGLFAMIFILGIVPIAGVFISMIPLLIIANSIGGINYVIYVIILIAVLHILESYILNPKLMANKTKLPVFITFLILIISEHFMGIWGLIIGIPITMFFLDMLEVNIGKDTEPEAAVPDNIVI
jgi:predicted PurR-regulated permease PerM